MITTIVTGSLYKTTNGPEAIQFSHFWKGKIKLTYNRYIPTYYIFL